MTLEDLIEFLEDACVEQTLTVMAIRRTVLLAYELGLEQGKQEAQSRARITARTWLPAARAKEGP